MLLSDFDYHLPEELIATEPLSPRENARLLCIGSSGELKEKHIYDLPDLLNPNDILVFNDTKVIPAHLVGRKGEARIDFNLIRKISENVWKTLVKPAKKLDENDCVEFGENVFARVLRKLERGEVEIEFSLNGKHFNEFLEICGSIPLPPYILSKRELKTEDKNNYQTVFAKKEGAVAAPTAGLHFTDDLLNRIQNKGPKTTSITLHVGAGTFLPVITEKIEDHKMHEEWYSISEAAAESIEQAKLKGGRVIAVGTTALRAMESTFKKHGKIKCDEGLTDIFITPGCKIFSADVLLTNFHLPKSTLLMLVSAFSKKEFITGGYNCAIENKYRFFSYGDACLIEKTT